MVLAILQESDAIDMPVPSSFNDITTDHDVRDFVGWVWYQRIVQLPKLPQPRASVLLHFGSAEYYTQAVSVSFLQVIPFQCCFPIFSFLFFLATSSDIDLLWKGDCLRLHGWTRALSSTFPHFWQISCMTTIPSQIHTVHKLSPNPSLAGFTSSAHSVPRFYTEEKPLNYRDEPGAELHWWI